MYKDTVMSDDQIIEFMAKLIDNPSLLVRMIEVVGKAQYQAGRKEVVEFIKDYIENKGNIIKKYWEDEHHTAERWQSLVALLDTIGRWGESQLKEWGL